MDFAAALRSLLSERETAAAIVVDIDRQLAEVRQALGMTAPASDVEAGRIEPDPTPDVAPAPVVAGRIKPEAAPTSESPATKELRTTKEKENNRRQQILDMLKVEPLPTREVAQRLQLRKVVAKMTLQRMQKVGLIVSVGLTNQQRWTLSRATTAPTPTRVSGPPPPKRTPWTPPEKTTGAPIQMARAVADQSASEVVEARDAAVIKYLNQHNGLASHKQLLDALPKDDPAVTPDGRRNVLQLALTRLKAKGRIDRTGDTWSLVGIGTSVAHG